MLAKVSGTPMNADFTPMNAEKAILVNGAADSSTSAATLPIGTAHPDKELLAFIGVKSAFIGVPEPFARHAHDA